jgi:hypothetical protein
MTTIKEVHEFEDQDCPDEKEGIEKLKNAKGNFIVCPRKDIILKIHSSSIVSPKKKEDEGTPTSKILFHLKTLIHIILYSRKIPCLALHDVKTLFLFLNIILHKFLFLLHILLLLKIIFLLHNFLLPSTILLLLNSILHNILILQSLLLKIPLLLLKILLLLYNFLLLGIILLFKILLLLKILQWLQRTKVKMSRWMSI